MSVTAVRRTVREGRFRVSVLTLTVPGWTASATGRHGVVSILIGLLAVIAAVALARELWLQARRWSPPAVPSRPESLFQPGRRPPAGRWAASDTANAAVLAVMALFLGVSLLAGHAPGNERAVAMIFAPLYAAVALGYTAVRRRMMSRPPEHAESS